MTLDNFLVGYFAAWATGFTVYGISCAMKARRRRKLRMMSFTSKVIHFDPRVSER